MALDEKCRFESRAFLNRTRLTDLLTPKLRRLLYVLKRRAGQMLGEQKIE